MTSAEENSGLREKGAYGEEGVYFFFFSHDHLSQLRRCMYISQVSHVQIPNFFPSLTPVTVQVTPQTIQIHTYDLMKKADTLFGYALETINNKYEIAATLN